MVTAGTPATLAAEAATATIPMIFNIGVDPVQFGLAASHSRPGGNLTGVAILSADLAAKKLEVLHELLPDASVVAMLVNPANPSVEPESKATQDAARSLGVQLHILRASTAGEIDAAFASLAKLRARALVVSDDSYFLNQRAQVMALAARGNRLAIAPATWRPRTVWVCAAPVSPLENLAGVDADLTIGVGKIGFRSSSGRRRWRSRALRKLPAPRGGPPAPRFERAG